MSRCHWKDGVMHIMSTDTTGVFQSISNLVIFIVPSVDSGSIESRDHGDGINELCLGVGPDLKWAAGTLKTVTVLSMMPWWFNGEIMKR